MDDKIKQLITVMRKLDKLAKSKPQPRLNQKALDEGLRLSRQVCAQPETVVATPLMKNLLVAFGDVKQVASQNGEWHTEKLQVGKKSKAVDWVNEVVNKCLSTYNGRARHDYPRDLPISSIEYYNTDCWLGWKPEIWDIQPGQAEQRRKRFKEYTNPTTNMSVEAVIKMISQDPLLRKAILIEFEIWPDVQASREIKTISDPFQSKGTGVSYPYYRNDRTVVPGTKETYGKYLISLLTDVYLKRGLDGLIRFAYDYCVYTGYPRNQRAKGRALIAMSRIVNLVVNMVNAPEMEKWKSDQFNGVAFQDEETILRVLSEMCEWAVKNDECAFNLDYSAWDYNLGEGWLCLQDSMRYIKATDQETRQLIGFRYACNTNAYFVDGPNNSVRKIYGRQMSGYDDTTLGNTCAQRIISRYSAMSTRPDYYQKVTAPRKHNDLVAVGDDLCLLGISDKDVATFVKTANKKCHVVIHEDDKHAKGVMFIQWRCFKYDGQYVIAYNWPRVLRSMLSKEDAKNLGRGGWTLSFYQQLGKLLQVPNHALNIVVNIAAACDQYHLSLDVPVSELIKMVQEEDSLRIKKEVSNRKDKLRRKNSTAERLYNGNPNLPGVKQNKGGGVELDPSYFEKVQAKLKSVYDPDFLPKLGFKNPDLSKVHFD